MLGPVWLLLTLSHCAHRCPTSHSILSPWQLGMGHGGSIYTTEIGKLQSRVCVFLQRASCSAFITLMLWPWACFLSLLFPQVFLPSLPPSFFPSFHRCLFWAKHCVGDIMIGENRQLSFHRLCRLIKRACPNWSNNNLLITNEVKRVERKGNERQEEEEKKNWPSLTAVRNWSLRWDLRVGLEVQEAKESVECFPQRANSIFKGPVACRVWSW